MAALSWLDIPLAALVLLTARRLPVWLASRTAGNGLAGNGLAFGVAGGQQPWPAGLAESDERLATADQAGSTDVTAATGSAAELPPVAGRAGIPAAGGLTVSWRMHSGG
jgi:hypothetical protein